MKRILFLIIALIFVSLSIIFAAVPSANNDTKGMIARRYMSQAEAKVVKETGLLRGGNPGKTYFTNDIYTNALIAKDKLSLPTLPDVMLEFRIINNPKLILRGTKVAPVESMSGNGTEMMTTDTVEVEIIRIAPLDKQTAVER